MTTRFILPTLVGALALALSTPVFAQPATTTTTTTDAGATTTTAVTSTARPRRVVRARARVRARPSAPAPGDATSNPKATPRNALSGTDTTIGNLPPRLSPGRPAGAISTTPARAPEDPGDTGESQTSRTTPR